MKINVWLIGAIITILILWWILSPKSEFFDIFPATPFGAVPIRSKMHVLLDKDGNEECVSYQSPQMNGINGCALVPCPPQYESDTICWCCDNYF
jgi:hypothetical protein